MGGRSGSGWGKASAQGGFGHAPAVSRHIHWHFGTMEGDCALASCMLQAAAVLPVLIAGLSLLNAPKAKAGSFQRPKKAAHSE